MIFEIIEPYLEAINLVLAGVIVFFGIQITFKLKGELKNAWKYLFISILLFGLHEVIGSLAEFNIFELEGLYAFTEFIFIIAFFFSTLTFKKLFEKLSVSKK
jgi:hypothetical protein